MKPKIFLITLLLILFTVETHTYACLQPAGSLTVNERIQIEEVSAPDFMRNFVFHKDRAYWEKVKNELQATDQNSFGIAKNNLAVALIHLGQVKEAIKILEELEAKSPGDYFTAANLGTAYELNGENQKALDWIREGVNRKKQSHYGTEWLHIKILEAKLAMEKEPDWLKKNSILGVDFNPSQSAQQMNLPTDYLGQQKTLSETEEALVYQLHERLEFVKPPEPVVSELLLDLSKVFAVRRTAEHAKAVNDLALAYAVAPDEIKNKPAAVENESKSTGRYICGAILTVIVVFLLGLFYSFTRKRKIL